MDTDKILLVQGDDLPRITLVITDLDGNPESIAGCTGANVHWRAVGSTDAPRIIPADVDTVAGTVSFDFSGGVLANAGEFEAEVELSYSGLKHTLREIFKFNARPQFA